jgi:hypothetical protein
MTKILKNMVVEGLIEKYVRQSPFIHVFTKKQLINGNQKDFGETDYPGGLLKGMNIKIPRDMECESKEVFYGYPALVKPWPWLNDHINNVMRRLVIYQILNGGSLADLRIIVGLGYVREDGTLDPTQSKGMTTYVLFMGAREYRVEHNIAIEKMHDWKQLQILRNKQTHRKVLEEKKRSATKLIENNRKLLAMNEWRDIIVNVDRNKIKWSDDD